jgi:hypothetical protein
LLASDPLLSSDGSATGSSRANAHGSIIETSL